MHSAVGNAVAPGGVSSGRSSFAIRAAVPDAVNPYPLPAAGSITAARARLRSFLLHKAHSICAHTGLGYEESKVAPKDLVALRAEYIRVARYGGAVRVQPDTRLCSSLEATWAFRFWHGYVFALVCAYRGGLLYATAKCLDAVKQEFGPHASEAEILAAMAEEHRSLIEAEPSALSA